MGLFNLFSKNQSKPYKDESLNKIYELLFCDNLNLYQNENSSFDILSENASIEELKDFSENEENESRLRILTNNLLIKKGFLPKSKTLLGVIIEVGLDEGLDVLAAFADGTARYINYSEKLLVWETVTENSQRLIQNLFNESQIVVSKIGPWDKERKAFPAKGNIRLTFLVSDGLYFGEGPMHILQNDQMGKAVIDSAIELMEYLTSETTNG